MTKRIETLLRPANLWIFQHKIITIAITLSLSSCTKKTNLTHIDESNTFKFNLPREIKNLDPLLVRGLNQRYILFNIHRGLFYYDKDNTLTAYGAKKCNSSKDYREWTCELRRLKYHNQKEITSEDYINTYELIKTLKEESLTSLDNIAKAFALSDSKLVFKLKKANSFFLHQLTNINLSPREEKKIYNLHDKSLSYSGPYKVKKHTESEIVLTPNKNFKKNPSTISVKGLFVDDSTTALSLFETKRIDFLRYLETSFFPKYKKKAFLAPHIKLDGLFLNPKLPIELRKKLTHSLRFKDLKIIFRSKGMPGCLQLSHKAFSNLDDICLSFKNNKQKINQKIRLKISIPSISQKDHVRLAEWLKNEWQLHLGLKAEIEQLEIKVFYQKANRGNLDIYRRSVPLSELHCNHAKKTLLKLPEFKDSGLTELKSCSDFFKQALSLYVWIPLGLVHIPHLHASHYKGYYINMLDQFGLEDIKRSSSNE